MDAFELRTYNTVDANGIYAVGGNKEKSKLPMIFSICGDFTAYKEIDIGKTVRFVVDGFDEDVELLEVSKEKITISTSHEIGRKLIAAGICLYERSIL
ncbi:hypothetical protein YDYSG_56880 [Paenibacillus tyrfis]|uniref:hypothetical protein n=1 Tax=Paenibacillus tyrfis TaxID=1501230 RepID=UPI002492D296|nr:hypothetical protein [Paenibacillus tyrfis]GLI09656.1 hypothetical protein YDYSG_56880 [Paenibacillus tyrfis]